MIQLKTNKEFKILTAKEVNEEFDFLLEGLDAAGKVFGQKVKVGPAFERLRKQALLAHDLQAILSTLERQIAAVLNHTSEGDEVVEIPVDWLEKTHKQIQILLKATP